MTFVILKQGGAIALIAINLVLLIRTVTAYRQKRAIPPDYFRMATASPALAAGLFAVGLYFMLEGRQAHVMHIFYGVLVILGAAAQWVLRGNSALAQTARAKPLWHAFVALFILLLAARSWMSG